MKTTVLFLLCVMLAVAFVSGLTGLAMLPGDAESPLRLSYATLMGCVVGLGICGLRFLSARRAS